MPSNWETVPVDVQERLWFTKLPPEAGCYVAYSGDELLYVGETHDLRQRLGQHMAASRKTKGGEGWVLRVTHIKIAVSARYGDWRMREARLLSRLRPTFNRKMCPRKPNAHRANPAGRKLRAWLCPSGKAYMLDELVAILRLITASNMNDQDRARAMLFAGEASLQAGVIRGAEDAILAHLKAISVADQDGSGWHFKAMRSKAKRLERQLRYRNKSKASPTTPAQAGDGGEGNGWGGAGVRIENKREGVGEREGGNLGGGAGKEKGAGVSVTSDAPSQVTHTVTSDAMRAPPRGERVEAVWFDEVVEDRDANGDLPGQLHFPGFETGHSPAGEQAQPDAAPMQRGCSADARRPRKPRKPRDPDPLWECVAQLTGSDRVVTATYISKVANLLKQAEPPYTVEEIRRLPAELKKTKWWDGKLSLGIIEKHIGLVRANAQESAAPPEPEKPRLSGYELDMAIVLERRAELKKAAAETQARMAERKRQREQEKREKAQRADAPRVQSVGGGVLHAPGLDSRK